MTTFFDAYGGMEALAANRQVSAEDVAREAGVSRTTVSFVINATPGKIISEETRRAVLDAVRKLGYRPNEDARRLALQRRFSVGLYIRHSSTFYNDSFLTRVVEGMVHTVNRHRVRLVVHPIHGGKIDCAMLAGEDEVDGIILVNTSEDDTTAGVCVDLPFPVVVMDPAGHVACDQVYISNDGGASEVVRYLVSLGHRRVAMIAHAGPEFAASNLRIAGFRGALEQSGIPTSSSVVRHGDFSERSGYRVMQEILELSPRPTAVFCGNDLVAFGAMAAIREAGLRVPADVSVAGFDDAYLSRFVDPPLTTMAIPAASLGSEAVSLVIARLLKTDREFPSRVMVPGQLLIRQSCAPPSGGS
jgi:LacI family transcriptional regulator